MTSSTLYRAGWLVIGLCVLPLISVAAGSKPAETPNQRLEWLLTMHDVRQAIHVPALEPTRCMQAEAGSGR